MVLVVSHVEDVVICVHKMVVGKWTVDVETYKCKAVVVTYKRMEEVVIEMVEVETCSNKEVKEKVMIEVVIYNSMVVSEMVMVVVVIYKCMEVAMVEKVEEVTYRYTVEVVEICNNIVMEVVETSMTEVAVVRHKHKGL